MTQSEPVAPEWVWPSNEEINDFPDPLGFENEWHDWPADLAASDSTPSVQAEIFSREYLQNSWDSIQTQLATQAEEGASAPNYGIDFRFVTLSGEQAAHFVEVFGLAGHQARLAGMTEAHRKDNRLANSDLMAGKSEPLTLLVASERAGQGMFGPWVTDGKAGIVSRLKSALMHTRSDKYNESSGGSWGHGKKAIANASRCRTIAVYTHFDALERYPDDRTHSRFLGVTYWKSHDIGDWAHVGLGLLGVEQGTDGNFSHRFRPLEGDEADGFVKKLDIPGLSVRTPGTPEQLGTTYLIVEPSFDAADLAYAIERNWWPLLIKHGQRITLTDSDGSAVLLDPSRREELRPFLSASELAAGTRQPASDGESRKGMKVKQVEVGSLALTSDVSEGGWSYANPDENRSLVALIRNDMVIAYEPFPRKQRQKAPFLRGVLTVDREHDTAADLLRMSEPHLHNEWQTSASNSVPAESAEFAAAVLKAVQTEVSRLRSALREDDTPVARHFAAFSRVFSEGSKPSIRKPIPPPRKQRDTSIQFPDKVKREPEEGDPTKLRFATAAEIALSPKFLKSWAEEVGAKRAATSSPRPKVRITIGWSVREEAGESVDSSLLDGASCHVPDGFSPVAGHPGQFTGVLRASRDSKGALEAVKVCFRWSSTYFPNDWQVRPHVEVSVIRRDTSSTDSVANDTATPDGEAEA